MQKGARNLQIRAGQNLFVGQNCKSSMKKILNAHFVQFDQILSKNCNKVVAEAKI